ncbi:sensor histidine kinase [Parafilimonas sp.]|uniref:sensor histidine kinase n=1 Tax=Parafilimonas sp. TaxID=1969739 RepID=UPI0039E491FB
MAKNTRILLAVCLLATAGVIVLQFLWIRNYYKVSLFNFERAINLAFEDAIKKDFQLRCDTIEQLLVKQLMDTSAFKISGKYLEYAKRQAFTITDVKNKKDFTTFSHSELKDALKEQDTLYKKQIAIRFAKSLRNEDLENHIVYYRTQSLGNFMLDKIQEYGFDTNRLRPVFQVYLNKRDIHAPFYFHTSKTDSTFNYIIHSDSLLHSGAIATKAFSTYKWWTYNEQYVRAVFKNPVSYVLFQMKWVLAGSLLLILLVGCCLMLLIKALLKEKRLGVIKNDFINNITHELKTPIATVSAAVEVLQDADFSREKDKTTRYLGYAKSELNRLAKLIDNILNISIYEKNKVALQAEPILIEASIKNIIEALTLTAGKPVCYTYENKSETNMIQADKLLFHQAMINVLDNAIKYSDNKAKIEITCYNRGNNFCIQCTDYGEGIAARSLPHVFEKFYREPKPNHTVKGFGLGLNYVQEIMTAHNGKIELTSVKRKGTTVILYWPL